MTTTVRQLLWIATLLLLVAMVVGAGKNGKVQMGVRASDCDDAENGLEIDWDGKDKEPYTCKGPTIPVGTGEPKELHEKEPKEPIHTCLTTKIDYGDSIPLSGRHRPLWPVYGEYVYAPPQRWVHSMEHAAVVLIYHPCAPAEEVEKFKKVVRGCLRKHLITPYNKLTEDKPYGLITWGNAIFMDHFDEMAVVMWIESHGMKDGSESEVLDDGQYSLGLKEKAKVIGDGTDSRVCYQYAIDNGLMMNMK